MNSAEMTLDQKFAKALIKMRELRPFFSAVYESIPHIATNQIETMGVTGKELLYNEEWSQALEFPEFMFVLLHEVAHIALMHVTRQGDRQHKLYNIAADLYINQLLAEEFNTSPDENDKEKNSNVRFFRRGLYCSSVDLDLDTTESIYEEFSKQAKKNGYFDKDNIKSEGVITAKSYHFEYTGSKRAYDKYKKFEMDIEVITFDPDKLEASGVGNSNNETSDDGAPNESTDQSKPKGGPNGNELKDNKVGGNTLKDNKGRNGGGSRERERITVNGQDVDDSDDLKDDGSDKSELESANKQILAEAQMKYDMMYKGAGSGSGILGRLTAGLLKSYIDWRSLLRKYCIQIVSKDSSFARPDKRMYYQDAIYPGNMSENQFKLERVKICFDRSGSISDDDTRYFYGQVKALMDEFKIEAEIINWDTDILSTGTLDEPNKIKHADIIHGGGTNPSCIFRYFDSKKCKIKPIVTVIFTDGSILWDGVPKWKRKYKDTIWVMTRNYNKDFKPEFGKLTVAQFNK